MGDVVGVGGGRGLGRRSRGDRPTSAGDGRAEDGGRNARALMAASVDLLCVKNDLYDEVPRFFGKELKKSAGRYFDDGRGQRMLVLFDETTVPSVAETIRGASFKGKVKIYVFAHGDYAYNEEFEEVADKVELCALPLAIRNAYRRVIGKYRPQEDGE